MPYPKQYYFANERYCEICGSYIHPVTRNGKPISKQTYNEKKTCGASSCYKEFKKGKRYFVNVEISPLDAFLSGKPYTASSALIDLSKC